MDKAKETAKSEKDSRQGASKSEKPVEPPVKVSKSHPSGDKGNPHYAAELNAPKQTDAPVVKADNAPATGGTKQGAPVKATTAQVTGDKGNPHYAAELNAPKQDTAPAVAKSAPKQETAPAVAKSAPKQDPAPAVAKVTAPTTGGRGNPHYAAELNAPIQTSAAPVSATQAPATGGAAKRVVEPPVTAEKAPVCGDKGNPHYAEELRLSAQSVSQSASQAPSTGGAPKQELAPSTGGAPKQEQAPATGGAAKQEQAPSTGGAPKQEQAPATGGAPKQEPVLKASTAQPTGDKGNPHYAAELNAPQQQVPPPVSAAQAPTTGDKGNPHYAAELNALSKEQKQEQTSKDASKSVSSSATDKVLSDSVLSAIEAQLIDKHAVEPSAKETKPAVSADILASIESQILPTTTSELGPSTGSTPKREPVAPLTASKAQPTGDKGNPHYAVELNAPKQQVPAPVSAAQAPTTGDKGNPHYAAELNALSKEQKQAQTSKDASKSVSSSDKALSDSVLSAIEAQLIDKQDVETSAKETKPDTSGVSPSILASIESQILPTTTSQLAPSTGSTPKHEPAALTSSKAQPTGDKGNPHYAAELNAPKQQVQPPMSAAQAPTTGDKGNPHYAAELNALSKEQKQGQTSKAATKSVPSSATDKVLSDSVLSAIEAQLIDKQVIEPTTKEAKPAVSADILASIESQILPTTASPQASSAKPPKEKDSSASAVTSSHSVTSPDVVTSVESQLLGAKPKQEVEKPARAEVIPPPEKANVTGDKGNPYHAAELKKLASGDSKPVAAPIQAVTSHPTGDKGNPHYAAQLQAPSSEKASDKTEPIRSTQTQSSGAQAPAAKPADKQTTKPDQSQTAKPTQPKAKTDQTQKPEGTSVDDVTIQTDDVTTDGDTPQAGWFSKCAIL